MRMRSLVGVFIVRTIRSKFSLIGGPNDIMKTCFLETRRENNVNAAPTKCYSTAFLRHKITVTLVKFIARKLQG